jgi:hypothetical protein
MRKTLLARTAVAVAVAGSLISPLAIATAAPAHAAAHSAMAATEAQRDRVRWRAISDPRWEVRAAAAASLTSSNTEAVNDFLTTGLDSAIRRAAAFERSNITEIKHALATSASGSAVHRGSERALAATHDEKDEFVRHGLAEAKREDAQGDSEHDGEVAKQAREDREYVAELARTDPGAQVRSAASFAANSGRDEDLAEFFSYYWAAGARLDDEAFRLKLADLDAKGNAAMQRLRDAALAAQAAEQEASGEAAAKLHAQTVAAWNALAASAEGTSVDWAAERDRAAVQAAAWGGVAEHASGATTAQDWAAVIARAGNSQEAWAKAVELATRQAAMWMDLANGARDKATGTPTFQTGSNR